MRCTLWRMGLALAGALTLAAPLRAAVPSLVPFQGVLLTSAGQPVADGPHALRFSLWTGPAGNQDGPHETLTFTTNTVTLIYHPVVGGSVVVRSTNGSVTYQEGLTYDYTVNYANGTVSRTKNSAIAAGATVVISYQWTYPHIKWLETQTVPTASGRFSTLLGASSPILSGDLTGDDYLEVAVESPPGSGSFEALLPRIHLGAAFYAQRVASIDGASGGTVAGNLTMAPGGRVIGAGALSPDWETVQSVGASGLGWLVPNSTSVDAARVVVEVQTVAIGVGGPVYAPWDTASWWYGPNVGGLWVTVRLPAGVPSATCRIRAWRLP